jgi:hypothetical protein
MSLQYSVALRNNQLDQVEVTLGASAKLRLLTGAPPANCAAAQTGALLCEIALPADWMTNAASGVKTKSGTWAGTGAAAGTVAHFRVVDNAGTTCHMQGTVTITGGGGDMTVDNTSIAVSQNVTVNTFTLGAGNA